MFFRQCAMPFYVADQARFHLIATLVQNLEQTRHCSRVLLQLVEVLIDGVIDDDVARQEVVADHGSGAAAGVTDGAAAAAVRDGAAAGVDGELKESWDNDDGGSVGGGGAGGNGFDENRQQLGDDAA